MSIRYIERRLGRMNYADARSQGLPIGSGAVEATCKSLVSLRMKRAGSRWKSKTGEDVLSLRALELSDRWDDALPRVLKPLRKRVQRLDRPMSVAAWGEAKADPSGFRVPKTFPQGRSGTPQTSIVAHV